MGLAPRDRGARPLLRDRLGSRCGTSFCAETSLWRVRVRDEPPCEGASASEGKGEVWDLGMARRRLGSRPGARRADVVTSSSEMSSKLLASETALTSSRCEAWDEVLEVVIPHGRPEWPERASERRCNSGRARVGRRSWFWRDNRGFWVRMEIGDAEVETGGFAYRV